MALLGVFLLIVAPMLCGVAFIVAFNVTAAALEGLGLSQ